MRSLEKVVLVGCIALSILTISFQLGKQSGIAQGRSMALQTNPPSEDLEYACAGLWVGEQNKEFVKRNANRQK